MRLLGEPGAAIFEMSMLNSFVDTDKRERRFGAGIGYPYPYRICGDIFQRHNAFIADNRSAVNLGENSVFSDLDGEAATECSVSFVCHRQKPS